MKYAVLAIRILLGVGFVIFGLNIVFPFLPQPPMPADALPAKFLAVAGPTHWMMVVGLFQLAGGILVLIGRTAPLGLALLAPVLVNVLLFHALLMDGEGLAPGILFTLFELFLIYAYRAYFAPLFTTKAVPAV